MLARSRIALGALLFACACSSRLSEGPSEADSGMPLPGLDGGQVLESDFAAAYAGAACDALAVCCATTSTPLNRDTCVATLLGEGQDVMSTGATTAIYNGTKAARCIADVRTTPSACATSSSIKHRVTLACKWIYDGTTPAGGACKVDQDCVAPAGGTPRCFGALTGGTCLGDTTGQAGELCGPAPPDPSAPLVTHQFCGDGMVCDATNHCALPLSIGAPCQGSTACGSGSYCDPTSGTCQQRVGIGATCGGIDAQCTSDTCYEGKCAVGETLAPTMCGL